MNIEEFRIRGKEMVEYICDYLQTLEVKRVTANVDPGYLRPLLPNEAPMKSESWDEIMKDVESKIMPGITHWQHPHFHAFFPSGNSFPSILGDMLSDAMGSICFSWVASPACTELEPIVLDWYAKAIDLPEAFLTEGENSKGGGVIQGSASECVLVTMLAARANAINILKNNNPETEDSVFLPRLVAYCSTESHSCVEKAAMICMVKLRVLTPDHRSCLRGNILEAAINDDLQRGLVPFFVLATLGTTGCCAFDNLVEIGPVCKKYPTIWLHVDGAYAGSSFICPELRYLMAGIEFADSFNTNPNKWLLVNFDCSCLWVRDRVKLTSALTVNPLYLQHSNSQVTIDYRHWTIPLSRRFRALKLWFVMRSYGITGLQKYIRNHIRLAKKFEVMIKQNKKFKVLNDVRMGLVCFRLKGTNKLNQELLANINASGKLYMTPAKMLGKYIIRFCVTRENAMDEDVNYAIQVIEEHANEINSGHYKNNKEEFFIRSPKSSVFSDKTLVKRVKPKFTFHDDVNAIIIDGNDNSHVDMINENVCKHRRNTATSFILEPENKNGIINSPLNPSHHTVIHIHGFAEDQSSPSAQGIKNAYLARGEFNIILVSWSKLAVVPWYINAVKNLPTVGAYIAKLIKWLEYRGVNYSSNLHVIGFSLGAHVAAFVGEELARNRFSKIGRITGLDPAGPAFESITTISKHLDKEDAIFVDIIHTNTQGIGIGGAIGHADFYVNYGESQPGCGILDVECSHGRSWELYVESVANPFGFPASICATWKPTVNQCTQARNVFMGFAVNQQSRGVFYVETQSRFPFAKNTVPSSKNIPANRNHIQQGGHAFYSYVDKLPIKLDERSVYYT
ncbi:hypothetical protein PV328_005761 [Microctonus aethiopoides]|uniref:Lipase domain-containing protein n=1 Tax=Microctonus aethiopoides TaxID=144406 RepID=A0AA39FN54_9HYME|nr:hypothetical protein PV328_005761 [Microctonus aethiopoides]